MCIYKPYAPMLLCRRCASSDIFGTARFEVAAMFEILGPCECDFTNPEGQYFRNLTLVSHSIDGMMLYL